MFLIFSRLQYVSCLLLALIQKEEENLSQKHDALIRAIIKIDTKRPLSFGDWINDILFPLLKAAKDRIPDNELVISLDKHMVNHGCNLFLGGKKDPSVVQIRNEYKGHSTTLSEDIYKGVIYTLEPRIFMMLKAISPLQDWTFFSCKEQTGSGKYRVNLLNGSIGKQDTMETSYRLEPFHYYIQDAGNISAYILQ